MANDNYNDALTTTLAYRSRQLTDNVSKNNALLRKLKEKSKIREISGGSKILEELEYGEGDMIWYNGYDTIDYTPKQLFTAAEFALKLCAVPVAISGEDLLKNSGPEKIVDLFEKRVENAMKTMSNQMSKAIYSDGTGSSGKEIGGLQFLVADAPETGVGKQYPFSIEKLTCILAFYEVKNLDEAKYLALSLIRFAGMGHSCAIHANDRDRVISFASIMPVSRVLVNTPSSQGGVGYSTSLTPSFTLGCGSYGGNSTSDNISVLHLFNRW